MGRSTTDHPDAVGRPGPRRRVGAIISLIGLGVFLALTVGFVVHSVASVAIGVAGLLTAVAGAWWVVTERDRRRIWGAMAIAAGLVVVTWAMGHALLAFDAIVVRLTVTVLVLGVSIACARYALVPDLHALDRRRESRPPAKPVLICNPRSGGGKVQRYGIREAAAELGVETVVLEPGDDLEQIARDAVASGADCLGMAGGDGSQALVASVAVEHDLPFVCVSAGTRNHFALDLGLDRADPRTTLRAFRDAVERRVDYATVNGRLFVNNVSLGVYATIVAEESYRDEKAQTAAMLLPDLLGPTAQPFDLQFTAPSGREVDGAFMILVSNNPYVTATSLDAATRRRMDTGTLGVIAVSTSTAAEAARLMARSAFGLRKTSPFWHEFTAESVVIDSRGGHAAVGIDGESMDLTTPLTLRSHPRGLRLLVPSDNRTAAARREARDVNVRALIDVAAGHEPHL
ncbi:diacylglycerol kinase family protein [Gordonia sp. PKS22-38]|uniref:Diacylglycerol kinase family protein n=1 Tax=Gordonia prachuapensis TaxID=3115651 RepID=A0ABU7MP44_9ACTN|nr:diacylglycerol kinase family protein [Gordonia sp. PKS22-38]